MIKVVIVDDERMQREGISRHIPWAELNMDLVGSAGDGGEALELMERYHVDVLITDIMMYGMTGIELARKAKKRNPQLEIMIISGYDEFEFARSAIELEAYFFMLKPINIEQLKEKLKELSAKIESKRELENETLLMRKQLEESKPLLVDKFLKDLIHGYLDNEETIHRRADALSVVTPESGYNILLIQIEDPFEQHRSEENHQLLFIQLYQYLVEQYENKGIVKLSKDNEYTLILYDIWQDEHQKLQHIDGIRESLQHLFNTTVTISVSSKKHTLLELHEAYREAEAAYWQVFYLGKGCTICYQDIYPLMNHPVSIEDKVERLIAAVEIGKYEHIEEEMDRILKLLPIPSDTREHTLKAFCFGIMSDIYKIIYNMDEKIEAIYGHEDRLWEPIYSFETIPDARQWLVSTLTKLAKHIHDKSSHKHSSVTNTIIDVLEQQYDEQITIEGLADKVFLTPNYICNIFKEHVGESIIDYLTKIRMNHAKNYLRETDMRIYEIADKTGFNSTSYFSSVFKKMFGVSPKEYREAGLTGSEKEHV